MSVAEERARPWILLTSVLGSGMSFIDYSALNVILPVLQERLGAELSHSQWIVSAYILFLSAMILTGGALGDRLGRRRVFAWGVVLFSASSLWCGISRSPAELIAARALQGLGGALLVPGSLSIINATFPPDRQPGAIGMWSAGSAVTTVIGPALGGFLAHYADFTLGGVLVDGWRLVFLINVPLAVIVLTLLYRHVPETRDEGAAGGLDIPGSLLVTGALAAVAYALISMPDRGWNDPLILGTLFAGLGLFGFFIWWEAAAAAPMLPLGLFRNPVFAGTNLLTLFLYAGLSGFMFFLPFLLIHIEGYTSFEAGLAFLPFVVVMFSLSMSAGVLVRLLGRRTLLTVGPLVAAVGFYTFSLPPTGGSYWWTYFPAVLLLATGMSLTVAPLTSTVMAATPQEKSGTASGINNAISRVAGLLAIAVLGLVARADFGTSLESRLHSAQAPAAVKRAILAEQARFSDIPISKELPEALRRELAEVVHSSFLVAFHRICYACALLAAIGGLVALVMLRPAQLRGSH